LRFAFFPENFHIMAGYSGTPLITKLGIKQSSRVCFVDPPESFEETLGGLPPGVEFSASGRGRNRKLDVIVWFTKSRSQLTNRFAKMTKLLSPAGGLWVAWPKRGSGVPTDLTEDIIRAAGLEAGLVDNKVCAIDEIWSGLRLVIPVKDRPQGEEFA
jgi:hypothetical protein